MLEKELSKLNKHHKNVDHSVFQEATTKIKNKYNAQRIKKLSKLRLSCETPANTSKDEEKRIINDHYYYKSSFITNPCEQLYGPSAFSLSNEISISKKVEDPYIPTPKWTRDQISILEDIFKKGRFIKSNEIKTLAQKFKVMENDVEEWFRKRRGKNRKIRRKNESLNRLIDEYLQK
jgi:hypothetical protein